VDLGKELSGWVQVLAQLVTMGIVYLISRLFPGHARWTGIWLMLGWAFVWMLIWRVMVVMIARGWSYPWFPDVQQYVTPLLVNGHFLVGFYLLYRILSDEPHAPPRRELPDPAGINTDESSVVTAWDAHAEAMFGYTASEAIGRRLTELIIPASLQQAHLDGVARYLRERDHRTLSKQYEVKAHDQAGQEFDVCVRVSVVPQTDGSVQFAGTINRYA
jgi:PAS domain S-box-containing protein